MFTATSSASPAAADSERPFANEYTKTASEIGAAKAEPTTTASSNRTMNSATVSHSLGELKYFRSSCVRQLNMGGLFQEKRAESE